MSDVEHAGEIDGDDVLPILYHRLRIGRESVAAIDAGIVHKDRDLTHLLTDKAGNIPAHVALGDIELEAPGLALVAQNGSAGLSRSLGIAVEHDDSGPLSRVAASDGTTDA